MGQGCCTGPIALPVPPDSRNPTLALWWMPCTRRAARRSLSGGHRVGARTSQREMDIRVFAVHVSKYRDKAPLTLTHFPKLLVKQRLITSADSNTLPAYLSSYHLTLDVTKISLSSNQFSCILLSFTQAAKAYSASSFPW